MRLSYDKDGETVEEREIIAISFSEGSLMMEHADGTETTIEDVIGLGAHDWRLDREMKE